ncbi:ABC transporter permease [Streptococcus mutans]|uniref:ABC transporter permease n=1 Tax=Streptococcus mutans TaxID=1309 RepID=UPI0028EA1769|nr:FtsX-like permease family protein [Streptococcus mutans]
MNDIEEVERKIANDYDVSFSQTFSQTTLKIGNEIVVTMVYGKIPSTIKVIKGNVPVNSDEIIIGKNLTKTLHKSVGDDVNIKTNNEKDKKYKIVGIYNSVNNLGKEAYILNSGYRKLGWPVKTNQKVIQFKKHEDIDKILDKNYNLDTSVIISNARSSTDNLIKVIQNALFFILLIVSVILLVLSTLITFLLTMVNIKQEDSELKIDRLLGFTVKLLRLQYVFRIEIITILGSILGFGIYYLFSESVLNMLTSLLGLSEIVVNLNFWSIVVVVVFFMVINLIITFISTYRLSKYRYIKK